MMRTPSSPTPEKHSNARLCLSNSLTTRRNYEIVGTVVCDNDQRRRLI
jgi:hypothetical protein